MTTPRRRTVILQSLLCIAAIPLLAVAMLAQAVAGSTDRAYRMVLAIDQSGNALIGGSEDETISSRAARGRNAGIWRWCLLCRLLDWIEPGHCDSALNNERNNLADAEHELA